MKISRDKESDKKKYIYIFFWGGGDNLYPYMIIVENIFYCGKKQYLVFLFPFVDVYKFVVNVCILKRLTKPNRHYKKKLKKNNCK